MVKKPAPGLPDVFAKPGGAPARGTPIEDLPTEAPDVDTPMAVASAPPGEPITGTEAPTSEAPTTPSRVAAAPATPAHAATGWRGGVRGIPAVVWGILIVSLTAPLWEGTVLSAFGVRSPGEQVAAQNAADLARQDVRVAALEQRLASTTMQLEAMRADAALASQRAAQATAQARAVALMRLDDALRGSAPFSAELAVLHANGGDVGGLRPVLAQLAPYAATGAPTLAQLLQDLRVLHDSVTRAVRQANPGSWMDLINWTGLNGQQPPVRIDPSLRAARLGLSSLAAGDIPGAIQQVSQVTDAFQADFADWITEAKARLAADAAVREIDAQIAHPLGTP